MCRISFPVDVSNYDVIPTLTILREWVGQGGRVSSKSWKTFRKDASRENAPAMPCHWRERARGYAPSLPQGCVSSLLAYPATPISQLSHTLGGAMRELISFACAVVLAACLLLASPIAHAQGVGASGSVSGTVTDPTGAVIPKGTVTAEDVSRGIRLTAT